MGASQKTITLFEVYNSITNNFDDQKLDLNSPFTFLEFQNYSRSPNNNIIDFDQYTIYLKDWQSINTSKGSNNANEVKNQFLNLLTEIKIKYTTLEEKKFISSLDVSNEENLEIIIPFFARKIKEICLYFANRRKTFNKDFKHIPQKGSANSISEIIRDSVISLFTTEDNTSNITSSKTLSSITNDLIIEVERQYDTFNDYYDLDPSKPPQFYNATGRREKYFSTNTNTITPEYFFSEDDAIRKLIQDNGVSLAEITGILINVNDANLEFLDRTDTVSYTQPTRDNIKTSLNIELAKNYMGTDYYYLSTNSLGVVVSGSLFETKSPYRNLLNINNPATLSIGSDDTKSERSVGLFFKPTYQGVLRMDSKFNYSIDKEKLQPNKVYVFPDPARYAGISNLSKDLIDTPIVYTLEDKKTYRNLSNSLGRNLPKVSNSNQPFASYTSIEQKRFVPDYSGKFKGIAQFENSGDIYSKETDIFGNIFVSFSNDTYFNQNISQETIGGTPVSENFQNKQTTFSNISTQLKETLSNKQLNPKTYYVVDIITQNKELLHVAFANVFRKYSTYGDIQQQIEDGVIEFTVFKDVFFIRTINYVIIDSYSYNGTFNSTGSLPVIITYNSAPDIGKDISFVTNPFRIDNQLYYIKLETRGNTNTKYVIHSIYKYDIDTFKNSPILDLTTNLESTFVDLFSFDSMTTNIVKIRQSKLVYNSKSNLFSLTTNYSDLNYTPLFHILLFKIVNNEMQIFLNRYLAPTNYNITQNFFLENTINNFLIQAIDSEPTEDPLNGTISF